MPNKASTAWHLHPPSGLSSPTAKKILTLGDSASFGMTQCCLCRPHLERRMRAPIL